MVPEPDLVAERIELLSYAYATGVGVGVILLLGAVTWALLFDWLSPMLPRRPRDSGGP